MKEETYREKKLERASSQSADLKYSSAELREPCQPRLGGVDHWYSSELK